MKKLQLDVEMLRVDSFETSKADERRGTVNAASELPTFGCSGDVDCIPWPTRYCD